jgi:hypothetical protein
VPPVQSLTELYNEFRRGRGPNGRDLPHREAARLGGDVGKYETFRKIGKGEHGGDIEEETVQALVKLGLDERKVRVAAGHQVERVLEPFTLPARANRLTTTQRTVVLSVVDTILDAAEEAIAKERKRERPTLRAVASQATGEPGKAESEATAKARRRRGEMDE